MQTDMAVHPERVKAVRPRLREIALKAIVEGCEPTDAAATDPRARLLEQLIGDAWDPERSFDHAVDAALDRPHAADASLVDLAVALGLSRLDLLAVALAAAVEDDPRIGRVLAFLQAPAGGARPTLGLLAHALGRALAPDAELVSALLDGVAVRTGLLLVADDGALLPERAVSVPIATCLALGGHDGTWPGITIGLDAAASVSLPAPVLVEAKRQAFALESVAHRALVVRSGSPAEARSAAQAIAEALGRRPAFIDTDKLPGVAPWLLLRELVPVFCHELAPGDRRRLPNLPGYEGPVLAVCGLEGSVETPSGASASWTLPIPSVEARCRLWLEALGDMAPAGLAERLGRRHRHGAGRIAHLGRLAQHHAAVAGRPAPSADDVMTAAWTGEAGGLDALAQALPARIPDDALVAPPPLRAELEQLLDRCRVREELTTGLGASARTRYQPGVRALFTGPSGTGKTLAASWIATRLELPLYRVDLASVTSKYIGETEKNLSQLLARAEQAEVVLLFDEADSLFGKRTEITHSNDRFANAQTNYLLQRIEQYEGIVLLTSNSQARFDEAFTRRLDFIVEFPPPGADERKALWQSHVGRQASLAPSELNRLAMLLDLNGGQIRNIVLAAAVAARSETRPIVFQDLVLAAGGELRKTGRQVPVDLQIPGQ